MNDANFINQHFRNAPPVTQFKRRLEELKKLDISNLNYHEVRWMIYNYCLVIPKTTIKTRPENFLNRKLYRARFNVKENIYNYKTFSYPPNEFSIVGRGNIKGNSVFYCADHPLAAILECSPQVGDIGYISIWRPHLYIPLNVGIYFPIEQKFYNNHNDIVNQYYENFRKSDYGNYKEHMMSLIDFITERYINENYPYNITSFISFENLFVGEQRNHLIIYPSVKSKNTYTNYAFTPYVVENGLTFEKVIKLRVKSVGDITKCDFMSVGKLDQYKLKLVWNPPSYEDKLDFKII